MVHEVRELMEDFTAEFLRTEAAAPPCAQQPTCTAPGAGGTARANPLVAPVFGELYARVPRQPYAYHAREIVAAAGLPPSAAAASTEFERPCWATLSALRTFVKERHDVKVAWQAAHPYVVLLPVRSVNAATAAVAVPGARLDAGPAEETALCDVVTAAALVLATRVNGVALVPPPPPSCAAPSAAEQARRQQYLAQVRSMMDTDGSVVAEVAVAAQERGDASEALACTPLFIVASHWPYSIGDGLALGELLGAPAAVYTVSAGRETHETVSFPGLDHRDGGAVALKVEAEHAALLEYYAAQQEQHRQRRLVHLCVPHKTCADLALGTGSSRAALLEQAAEELAAHVTPFAK